MHFVRGEFTNCVPVSPKVRIYEGLITFVVYSDRIILFLIVS